MRAFNKQALNLLIDAVCFIFRERSLSLAKIVLPLLPYGKAVAIASILIGKFPTNDASRKVYESARPRWKHAFQFHLNPFCPLSKLFALTGLFQPEMTEELLKAAYQGVFVDIGANFGYFSVLWLTKQKGDALAIEPIRQNYDLLAANLRPFGCRAKTLMCCLGEHHGEVSMSYDPQFPMLSKISENSAHSQKLPMRTLVEVFENEGLSSVDVIKCDAEGHDVRILNNARELFEARSVRVLFFEPETWDRKIDPKLEDLSQLLLANGYRAIPNKVDSCYSLGEN